MSEASNIAATPPLRADRFPRLRRMGDVAADISTRLGGAALLCIMVICGANVVARYFFHQAFSWAEEAMVFLMIFVIFSASTAVTWKGAHMHLDMLVRQFPKSVRATINILMTLFSAGLLFVLAWNSYGVVSRLFRFGQRSEALHAPMWIPQSFLLIGVVLIALMMILRLVVFGATAEGTNLEAEAADLETEGLK